MIHQHYCLECNQVVGESADDCEVPQDHVTDDVCQTCAQHRAAGAADAVSESGAVGPEA